MPLGATLKGNTDRDRAAITDGRTRVAEGGIVIRSLGVRYEAPTGTTIALDGFDTFVPQGEFLSIVGPSGCGKTTLLRVLAGLSEPTSGSVTFEIANGGSPRQAMVFQEHGVFPWMTVLDNVAFGLTVRKVPRSEREAIAREYIDMLGLGRFAQSYPSQLSGGMRQRVSVARAFATDPAVLLMDEPFASLDEQTRMLIHQDLLRLWRDRRKTVIFITHSIDEAVALSDRIIVMSARPGRILDEFNVDIQRPRDVVESHNQPGFAEARSRAWTVLRNEINSLHERETGSPEVTTACSR